MTESRETLAINPNTDLNILEEFTEAAKSVRMALAMNPQLPSSIIEVLINDFDMDVRASLAKNTHISDNYLEQLFKNKNRDINEALAQNTSTPVFILKKLAYNSMMAEFLVKNTSTPTKILNNFIKNEKYLAKTAKKTLKEKLDNISKENLLNKYNNSESNQKYFQELKKAVLSKKLKILKDVIKETLIENEINIIEYKKLAIMAAESGSNPILKYLFTLFKTDKDFLSDCFLIAVKNSKQKTIEYLLDSGANINAINTENKDASIITIENGKLKLLAFLIEKNINLNRISLIESVKNNKPKIIDLLLKTNIDINVTDNEGNTALHHAIKMKKSKIVETLLNSNADLNIENNKGLVPLALAWNLDITPAVIDLLIDKETTNMIGEAGKKVMNEAFKISKGRKKDQRNKMKDLYLRNRVSSMSKEDFIKKHGKIEEIDSYIKNLKAPNGEDIMKGIFTNIGYFPKDTNFIDMEHNWEAIDYAIELSNKLEEILKDTHSLHSEGESYYKSFFIPEVLWVDLSNFDAKATREALDDAHDAYNKWPTSFSFYKNIFSEDIEEDYEDLTISEEEYKAFTKASKLMEKELSNLYSLQMYPSFIEFPWFFLGIDKYRNLVGVVTSAVWT